MRAGIPSVVALSLAALAGCASARSGPTPELLAARAAVVQAQESPLSPLAVAELRRAEQALAVAEREARERPRSRSARDAAYVARRRAQCSLLSSLVRMNLGALARGRQAVEQLRARAAGSAQGAAEPAPPGDEDLERAPADPTAR
ncbi:DUF4398 domain-containing protein [Sorangium sp. So ce1036]|uniref:DUF4398 domain-containing protein n=1 Tax=Sorangium sp. So ce1036 TaxID=3133328 RepID=UPI003F05F612